MDVKTRKQIQEKLKQRMLQLPPIFNEFLQANSKKLSLASRYEYAKDFHLFTDYLRKTHKQEINDQLIIQLEKQVYLNFLSEVYLHTRAFHTAAAQETQQQFKNGYYGISRKQYALNHFLRFLYEKGLVKKEISLLGDSLPETTSAAPRYIDASLLSNFDSLFVPEKGFNSPRKALFEQKNRARNLAIVAVLLYCGLKIHEVVELKWKNIDMKKQILVVDRKANRLERVPIPNEALPILANYANQHKNGASGESYVFRSSHDEQISPRTIRQILDRITVYKNVSPELCRKTFRYYTELYLGDKDAVNYLCGNRYVRPHPFEEIYEKMRDFSYR